VVTGTAFSGKVGAGDTAIICPAGGAGYKARVRGLHVQDRAAQNGQAGDRCALALTGDFEQEGHRARHVAGRSRPGTSAHSLPGRNAGAGGQAALKHWTPVHVHLGAADITGRVALLEGEAACAGRLAHAGGDPGDSKSATTLAVRGDRFVLRDASARHSIGGGRVLDCFPPSRHKRSPARLALLAALTRRRSAPALNLLAGQAVAGVDLDRFAANWNLAADAAAEALWRAGLRVIAAGEQQAASTAGGWQALGAPARRWRAEHERAPDMVGVERERLRRLTLPTLERAAFDALVANCWPPAASPQTRAWLHLPEHRPASPPATATCSRC
jgi:selenocysteine-specific elongation factor